MSEYTRQQLKVPTGVVAVALLLTLFVWQLTSAYVARRDTEQFGFRVSEQINLISETVRDEIQLLEGGAGYINASGEVSRAGWQAYFSALQGYSGIPGVQGLGLVLRVASAAVPEHVSQLRAEGFADYDLVPAGARAEYFPITYLEPADERNRRALGYDMAFEPVRRAAMETARDTGEAVLSGRVTLVQETDDEAQPGFLIFVPVYRQGLALATAQQRQAALYGYVYGPFRSRPFLSTILASVAADMHVSVYDGEQPTPQSLLYDNHENSTGPVATDDEFTVENRVAFAGHSWTIRFSGAVPFGAQHALPWLMLVSGLLLSLGLGLLVRSEQVSRTRAGQLERSKASLSATLYSIGDGVISTDTQCRVTAMNVVAEQLTGWTEAQALGLPISDIFRIINEETRKPVPIPVADVLATGKIHGLANHTVLIARDGVERPIADSAAPIRNQHAQILGVVLVFRDMSEEKRAEQEIYASWLKLEQAMDAADMASWEFVVDDSIFMWNDRFYALLGTTAAQEGGYQMPAARFLQDFCHPEDMAKVRAEISKAIAAPETSTVFMIEYRIVRRDNATVRNVVVHYQRAFDEGGQAVRVWGALQDITARKQIEQELAVLNNELESRVAEQTREVLENERRFHALLEHSNDGILVVDADNNIIYMSPAVLVFEGYTAEELAQRNGIDCFHPDDRATVRNVLQQLMTEPGRSVPVLWRRQHKNGQWRWFEGFATNLLQDPAVKGIVTNYRDVTRRVRAEEEIHQLNADLERRIAERTEQLEAARKAADTANRAKSAFLANMSHEIRTPLNAISGMVELLEHTKGRDEQARMLKVTRDSVNTLAGIIEDVLDLSKIEAGMLEVHLEPMSVKDVVFSAVELFTGSASARNLYLRLEYDERIPAAVRCDQLRLRQILFNLLGNAIKFTQAGGVVLRAVLQELGATHAVLCFEVQDTGIGISAEAQKNLFKPFVQAESNTSFRFGGTGLGLAISRHITELLGGELALQSEPGQGTTMRLTLSPALARSSELPLPDHAVIAKRMSTLTEADQPLAPGRRLLIVDDNAINRHVLLRQLLIHGYLADEAVDGHDALEKWRDGDYVMIIADCHMPVMDGYQLARIIREYEMDDPLHPHIPIVGYTANAMHDSREHCLAAGMDDVLIKPVGLDVLRNKLEHWITTRVTQGAGKTALSKPEGAAVNWQTLGEITGGDAAFGREMLSIFLQEKTAEAVQLADLLAEGDLQMIVHLAHRLQGAASTIAAQALAMVCERIQWAGNKGDRIVLRVARQELEHEFARLRVLIEKDGQKDPGA